MIINDLLMQNNISDSQADELNDIMKNRDIIEVLIVEADDENEILKADHSAAQRIVPSIIGFKSIGLSSLVVKYCCK